MGYFGFFFILEVLIIGFMFFIYCVGIEVGFNFFGIFFCDGKYYLILSLVVLIIVIWIVYFGGYYFNLDYGLVVGMMVGVLILIFVLVGV